MIKLVTAQELRESIDLPHADDWIDRTVAAIVGGPNTVGADDDRLTDRLDAASTSVGEQIGVVDQTDVAEPCGDGDAHPSVAAMVELELIDRTQVDGVEDGNVVEVCERLVVDGTGGGIEHVGHARTG